MRRTLLALPPLSVLMSATLLAQMDGPDWMVHLNSAYQAVNKGDLTTAEREMQAAWKLAEALGPQDPGYVNCLSNLSGFYDYQRGKPLEGERMLRSADQNSAAVLNVLANHYTGQMQEVKAEETYRRALALNEISGDEAVQALTNLVTILKASGRGAEAEPLYQKAISVKQAKTSWDYLQLAGLYSSQEKTAEAEEMLRKAIRVAELSSNPGSSEVSSILVNVANFYQSLRRFSEAEDLLKSVATDNRQGLLSLYQQQRRYEEADAMRLQLLAEAEAANGTGSPPHRALLYQQAFDWQQRGNPEQAEALFERGLSLAEDWAPSHPEDSYAVEEGLRNLANFYGSRNETAKAEATHRRIESAIAKRQGPDSPEAIQSRLELAMQYFAHGDPDRAESIVSRALFVAEGTGFQPVEPTVQSIMNAIWSYPAPEAERAESIATRCLALIERTYGADDPKAAVILDRLAGLYSGRGQPQRAEELLLRELAIQEKNSGAESPMLEGVLTRLAEVSETEKQLAAGERYRQRAIAIIEAARGPRHQALLWPLRGLASLYQNQARPDMAEPLLERALEVAQANGGPGHQDLAGIWEQLTSVYAAQGKKDQADAAKLQAKLTHPLAAYAALL